MNESTSKTLKVVNKLKRLLEEENFYEAHQLYRSLFNRLVKSEQSKVEAFTLIIDGITQLIKAKQFQSSLDLIQLLLENFDYSEKNSVILLRLFDLFGNECIAEISTVIDYIIRWSSKCGAYSKGDPLLHDYFCQYFCNRSDHTEQEIIMKALDHYTKGSGKPSDDFVKKIVGRKLHSLINCILNVISCHNIIVAKNLFLSFCNIFSSDYKVVHEEDSINVYDVPLLNFCQYVVLSFEKNNPKLQYSLIEHYSKFLTLEFGQDNADRIVSILKNKTDFYYGSAAQKPAFDFTNLMNSFLNSGTSGRISEIS